MITDYFMITEKSNQLQVIMITDYDYPISDGYHLKVFVLKLSQIHICQTKIVEKHLRRYYVRMNSMSKAKFKANHGPFCKRIKMIKKTSSNKPCVRDSECKMVRF